MKHILMLLLFGFLLPPSLSLLTDGGDHQATSSIASESNHVDLPDNEVKDNVETYPGSSSTVTLEMPSVEKIEQDISASESSNSLAPDAPEAVKEPGGFTGEEGSSVVHGGSGDTERYDVGNLDSVKGVHNVDLSSPPKEQMNVLRAQENQPSSPDENAGAGVPSSQPDESHLSQQQRQQQPHQQQQQQQAHETVGQPSTVSSSPVTDPSKSLLEDPQVPGGQAPISTPVVDSKNQEGETHTGEGILATDTSRPDNAPSVQPSQAGSSASNFKLSVEQNIVSSSLPVGTGEMAVNPTSPPSDGASFTADSGVGASNNGVDGKVDAVTRSNQKPDGGAGEEEFPTFDKWSVQYLAEQEKQKIEQEMEQVAKPGLAVGKKKLRLNFASSTCGAKIVASNPEADNINYLLNANPDEYLISPCKAKKWFVVELCEPLQIHKVEIGTMELFSSLPKSVRVLSSQRYPTKEWTPLGIFEMKAERTVQSFPTRVLEDYVKFVRVELLEHHGNEHYCPITFFRVLGLDMASDEEEEADHEALDSQDQAEGEQDDRSVSLFEKTKDTVVKLVQKVLYNGDGDETEQKESSAEKQGDNSTAESSETKEETKAALSPCSASTPTVVDEASTPSIHMPEAGCIPDPVTPKPESIPIVTKLADTEQLPPEDREPPLVVKLDTPKTSIEDGRQMCKTPWLSQAKLVYSGLMLHTSLAPSCNRPMLKIVKEEDTTKETVTISPSTISDQVKETATRDVMTSQTDDSITNQLDAGMKSVHIASPSNSVTNVPSASSEVSSMTEKQPLQEGESVVSKNSADTAAQSDNLQESLIASSQSTVFTSAGVSTPTTQTLEPSSLTRHADRKDSAASVVTPELHVAKSRVVNEQGSSDLTESMFLKVSPSPTTSVQDMQENTLPPETATTKLPQDIAPPKDISSGATGDKPAKPFTSSDEEVVPLSTQQKSENVTRKPSVDHRSMDLVKVPVTFNTKRDASFIKLNNRILALELNVSMTKKYLEELSRAFKQQNEDMMSLVNKTIYRLNMNIAASEEKDLHQQTQIDLLDQRLVNLTTVVNQMQVLMDDLSKELHQRQLIMGMLQALLFVWLMISTLRGRCRSQHSIADHQFLLDTMPKQPQVIEALDGSPSQRRNSDVGIKSEGLTDMPLKRQSSDTNIALSTTSAANAENMETALISSQGSKKKKRKKMKLSLPLPAAPSQANTGVKSASVSESLKMVDLRVTTASSSVFPVHVTSSLVFKPAGTHNPNCKALDEIHTNISPVSQNQLPVFLSKQAVKENIPILPRTSPPFNRDSQHPIESPQWPLYSVRENGLCSAQPLHSCPSPPSPLWSKSLTPPLGSLENVQLAQHSHSAICGFTHSSSPGRQMTLDVKDFQRSSPEFKLPSYHRSRLRKLGQALEASTSGLVNKKRGGGVAKRSAGSPFSSKKPSSHISAQQQLPFSDFFNEEILLSENRFHLPENEMVADQISPSTSINRVAAVGLGNELELKQRNAAINQSQVLNMTSYPVNSSFSPAFSASPSAAHSHHTIHLASPSFIPIERTLQPIVPLPSSVTVPKTWYNHPTSTSSVPFPASIPSLPAPPSCKTNKDHQQEVLPLACPLTLPLPKPKDQGGQLKSGGGKNGNKKTSPKSHRRQGSFPSELSSGVPTLDSEPKKRLFSLDGSSSKLPSKPSVAHTHGKMKKSGSMPAVQGARVQGQGVRIPKEVGMEHKKGAKC